MTNHHEESRDPVAAAHDQTAAMLELAEEVRRLRTYGRRNRKFIVFDIALTVLLSVVGAVSVHAVQSADSANQAQAALCQAGNVARAQQIGLWEYIFTISGPPKTPRAKKIDAEFEQHLRVLFAPRDCATLGNGR